MRKSSAKRNAKPAANVSNVPAVIENTEISAVSTDDVHADAAVVIDNATGETVQPDTATEAKPDPRAARAERIAADRAAVANLYSAFEHSRLSVPVKPLSAFKLAATTAHPIARNVSQRQCAALAVAFAAAGVKLASGATAPRVLEIDGKPCAIENGVLRDAVSSGLCTVSGDSPEAEIIRLSATATKSISGQLGATLLKAVKLA
jgi:hypothetical protein